jgi:hypothetical protein
MSDRSDMSDAFFLQSHLQSHLQSFLLTTQTTRDILDTTYPVHTLIS